MDKPAVVTVTHPTDRMSDPGAARTAPGLADTLGGADSDQA
jgi:hypothetical protein